MAKLYGFRWRCNCSRCPIYVRRLAHHFKGANVGQHHLLFGEEKFLDVVAYIHRKFYLQNY